MNLGGDGVVHGEVDIPARGPVELRVLLPNDVVREEHFTGGDLRLAVAGVDHVILRVLLLPNLLVTGADWVRNIRNPELRLCLLITSLVIVVVILSWLEVVLDREGLDHETDDPELVHLGLDLVVLNFEVYVVVNVRLLRVCRNETDGEALPVPSGDRLIVFHLGRGAQVVHDPVVMIVLTDGSYHLVGAHTLLLGPPEVGNAHLLAVHIRLHLKPIGG
mmetsp:Transcript_3384/g.8763  ORF Transcript_3384/g.8763 Transcript_3384/m.8763 type:complete len:219 (-) Transcript_3384:347-1003(-)